MSVLREMIAEYDRLTAELASLHEVLDEKAAKEAELRTQYYETKRQLSQTIDAIDTKGERMEELHTEIMRRHLTGDDFE